MPFQHTRPQYPVRAAFDLLDVSPPTGNKLIHEKILTTHVIGRKRYVSAENLDDCIRQLEKIRREPKA